MIAPHALCRVRLASYGLASILLILLARLSAAQDTGASGTTEVWPELDIYWRQAEHQRNFFELSASTEREGAKREATVGAYQDFLRLPAVFFRGGFRYTFSTRDASYRESRMVGEATYALYSSSFARLLNRTRGELRWVNGEYSYRLRDRLHLQHQSRSTSGPAPSPYITFEAYYDSRFRSIVRIGGRIGTEARLGGPVAIDVYIARQNNSRSSPKYVNALGVTTKLSY
jgi:hypothetical protein